MSGSGAVISNIMSRETGLRFNYERGNDDYENIPTIIFYEGMPWTFNNTEKDLTEISLFKIIEEYTRELGIENHLIGFQEIEYYG